MTSRRITRRRPEIVCAAVQPLELRRVLSAASFTVSSQAAAFPLSSQELPPGDLPPVHMTELHARLVLKRGSDAAPEGSSLPAPEVRLATEPGDADPGGPDPIADVTDLKAAGTRWPQISRRRSMPDLNHSLHLTQPDLQASVEFWGDASASGLDLLSTTLDRIPTVPSPPPPTMGTANIPVVPDRIDFPSIDLPPKDGGLIDVTPLYQQERLDDNTDFERTDRTSGTAQITDGDSGPSAAAMQLPDIDGDIPFTQPASITHNLRHQTTASGQEGGYIDFVAFAIQSDSQKPPEAHLQSRPETRSPHQEIDAAVGRHRTFQIAESTGENVTTAVTSRMASAVCLPAGATVGNMVDASEPHIISEPMSSPDAAPAVPDSGNHWFKPYNSVAPPVESDHSSVTGLPPLPTNMLLPALGIVGALRSGVRQRLRRMVTGLVRKL